MLIKVSIKIKEICDPSMSHVIYEEKVKLRRVSVTSTIRSYITALAFVLESRTTLSLHECHMKASDS